METHGIFGNERVMQFLITMKALAEQCFRQLHTVSHERQCETAVAAESFRVGLRYISNWNDSIMEQEATHAIAKYPDIVSNYKFTLVHYVKLTHRDKRAEVQLSVPPFKQFLHWFLIRISSAAQMQDASWVVSAPFGEKDVFYREMLRQTIASDCLPQNLRFAQVDAVAVPQAPQDVFPHDSISNVPPVSASMVDVRPTKSGPVQQLTPSLLHMHTEFPSSVGGGRLMAGSAAGSSRTSSGGSSSASSASSEGTRSSRVSSTMRAASRAPPAGAVPAAPPPPAAAVAPQPAYAPMMPALAMMPPQGAAGPAPGGPAPVPAPQALGQLVLHGAPLNPNQIQ